MFIFMVVNPNKIPAPIYTLRRPFIIALTGAGHQHPLRTVLE